MRIISQDGTRDFSYDEIGLLLRTRIMPDQEDPLYVITALAFGNEYDMGYFSNMAYAYDVMSEIRNTPTYIYDEDDFDDEDDEDDISLMNPDYGKTLWIRIPTEDEMYDED